LGYAVAVCGTAGFVTGGFEGIAVGAFVACGIWFCIFKGGQEDTERRRRQAVTPIPCQEDCEAFIVEHQGDLHLCLARGDMRRGTLPVVSSVPWDGFSNFEEGSRKHWFSARGPVDGWPDAGVIVAQSNDAGVVLVAQSLGSNAWLTNLLGHLQATFIVPRNAALKAFRREALGDQTANSDPGRMATPTGPF
jgi:hypothetical protein